MTTEQQLSDTYKSQIKTCEEAIDRAMDLRQKGNITDKEYYSRIDQWDDKRHEVATKLARLGNG